MVWDCLIVGLLRLHRIQSLDNVTTATIVIGESRQICSSQNFLQVLCLQHAKFFIFAIRSGRASQIQLLKIENASYMRIKYLLPRRAYYRALVRIVIETWH
jgi:hypothetical protein